VVSRRGRSRERRGCRRHGRVSSVSKGEKVKSRENSPFFSATDPADEADLEMTLGSYPAAFISDETLFEATLEAELTLLLACESALSSERERTELADEAELEARSV
jgi:hypothetical protein